MSFRLVASAWESDIKSPGCKLVLMGLASYCNEEGECWPRQETLAERTCQSVRTVRDHLAWLEGNGYIQREHRNTTSGRCSDMYLVTIKSSQPAKSAACATGKKPQSQPAKIAGCSILESVINNTPDVRDSAEVVYHAYPRKVGKLAALKAIEKALKISTAETLLAKVKAFSDQTIKDKTEERFIPHPATWFNSGRWMDEAAHEGPDYSDKSVWPYGDPAKWPASWIKHPIENRPFRPGEMK